MSVAFFPLPSFFVVVVKLTFETFTNKTDPQQSYQGQGQQNWNKDPSAQYQQVGSCWV